MLQMATKLIFRDSWNWARMLLLQQMYPNWMVFHRKGQHIMTRDSSLGGWKKKKKSLVLAKAVFGSSDKWGTWSCSLLAGRVEGVEPEVKEEGLHARWLDEASLTKAFCGLCTKWTLTAFTWHMRNLNHWFTCNSHACKQFSSTMTGLFKGWLKLEKRPG